MKTKRILFLGGAYSQIPIIIEAKNREYYIITCDYCPSNPGHKLADEYHNVSTTDFEGVLNIAKKVRPDYVVAYASDPAASVAAYVSEKLGLPGNSYNSVCILSNKDLFRNFQKNHQFNTPGSVTILKNDNSTEKVSALQFPILIKPSDSSGSKGISRIEKYNELQPAINLALSFSRNKRIVAEEFIECDGAQLHGDGFIKDGKLVFAYLGDHHFNTFINPFVPCSTTWPSTKPAETIKLVEIEINRLINEVGYLNGPINIEVRINKEGKIYIGEIGPRNGGNYVPQAIKYATGFDMVKATLDVLTDSKIIITPNLNKFSANYVIHSDKEGKLEELSIDKELNSFVKEFHQYCIKGDKINTFQNSNAAIGLMLLQFNDRESMDFYMTSIEKYINLKIV